MNSSVKGRGFSGVSFKVSRISDRTLLRKKATAAHDTNILNVRDNAWASAAPQHAYFGITLANTCAFVLSLKHTCVGIELTDEVHQVGEYLVAALQHTQHDEGPLDVFYDVLRNLLNPTGRGWAFTYCCARAKCVAQSLRHIPVEHDAMRNHNLIQCWDIVFWNSKHVQWIGRVVIPNLQSSYMNELSAKFVKA